MPEESTSQKEATEEQSTRVLETPEVKVETETPEKKEKRDPQERINHVISERKEMEYKFDQSQKELEESKQKIADLESKPQQVEIKKETVEADGVTYYTDTTLNSMITAGTISNDDAYKHQQDRITAIASDRAYERLNKTKNENDKASRLENERVEVFGKYPEWDIKDPNHDPKDKKYVTANEYYNKGLSMKEAMLISEKLHGPKEMNMDNSDNLNMHSPSPSSGPGVKTKTVTFSEDEQEFSINMYRNQENPKTGRNYTDAEAIEKGKLAKERSGK